MISLKYASSILVASLLATSCTRKSQIASYEEESQVGPTGFSAVETNSKLNSDPLRKKLGSFLLVEQFNTQIFESMRKAIKDHPPAGIVYWNPQGVGAEEIFRVNADYSKTAEAAGVLPLLLSADYEGGGLNQTLSGKSVIGIQRFVNGFTKLAHPAWLGASIEKLNTRLCYLHGEIMAKELKLAGFNYPLATVSDLSLNLFANRGISKDPTTITLCLKAIVDAFAAEKSMTFVTKHFPGLGETRGDTHEETVVSKARTMDELYRSVAPFSEVIKYNNSKNYQNSYSILASHAKYGLLDNENITTVSKPILVDFLRGKLHYQGVVVSDAMWMGEYGHLANDKLMRIYVKSILAGMDLLMISGKTFVPAVQYFRGIYDDTLSNAEKSNLTKELKLDWGDIRTQFIERLKETSERVEKLRSSYIYAHKIQDINSFQTPSKTTEKQRTEYYQGLKSLGMVLAK